MNVTRSTILGGLLVLASCPVLAQSSTLPPGRLLASNCFQCHGTNGSGGFERLAGMSASEIIKELKEMRGESNPGIMEVHARGYNDQQLQALANYFASLKTSTSSTTSSTREASHD
jgi:cytochrome c553